MKKKNTEAPMQESGSCCGSGACGHGMMMHTHCHYRKGGFFRFLFSVLVVVFVVGAVLHAEAWNKYRMMNGGYGGYENSYVNNGYGMMGYGNGYGMMGGFFDRDENGSVFGTISKIDKNNITITDNAGAMQTFQTTAETMILKSTGPVALSALKVGEDVMVSVKGGKRGDDDDEEANTAMTAKVIRVVEPITLTAPVAPTAPKK